jgi:hypothetical protein
VPGIKRGLSRPGVYDQHGPSKLLSPPLRIAWGPQSLPNQRRNNRRGPRLRERLQIRPSSKLFSCPSRVSTYDAQQIGRVPNKLIQIWSHFCCDSMKRNMTLEERNALAILADAVDRCREEDMLFIRTCDEAFSIVAMCVNNPDRSPGGINR